jgi:hypothetical protein
MHKEELVVPLRAAGLLVGEAMFQNLPSVVAAQVGSQTDPK